MDYARILSTGVGGWLQFEFSCDRSGLFSEKYLSTAIGQILSSRTGNRAHAEFKHPVLAPLATGAGRRPEIDFVVFNDYPTISVAVESKWVGTTTPSVQSILWDLIRLEMLVHLSGARCFFVLGGKRADLTKLFSKAGFVGLIGQHPHPLLRLDKNLMHRVTLVPHMNPRVPILKSLFEPYQEIAFPHAIRTRRAEPYPIGQPAHVPQVYVWEVSSTLKRLTFYPKNSKYYSLDGSSKRDPYRARARAAAAAIAT